MNAAALRRNLWLFHLYRFLSTSYLFIPVLYLQSRGLSYTEIGLLSTVYCVTVMLFEVPTGALADHFGRRRAMAAGSLMMAAGCLVDYFGRSFIAFAAGDGLLALGMTLTSGADSAYLFDLLRHADRDTDYRRLEGSATAAKLVGTALALLCGGWVAQRNLPLTYAASAAVCLVSALVALLLSEPRLRGGAGGSTDSADSPLPAIDVTQPLRRGWLWPLIRSAIDLVGRERRLRFAIGFSVLVFTLLREGMYLYPIYLKTAGFKVGTIGLLLAALTLLGAWSAHRVETIRLLLGERRLLIGLPVLMALTYLAMGRWFAGWGVLLLMVQMLINGIYSPLSKELLNREIRDSSQRATVLSMESMSRRLVFGIVSPLVGVFMDRLGTGSGFFVCGALGIAGSAALYGHHLWRARRGLSTRRAGGPTVSVSPAAAPPASFAAPPPRHGQSAR
jgi:MFS family permease